MIEATVRASLVFVALALTPARGDDGRADPTLERQILPILKARCVKCHGPAKREGSLSLASPKALARGGKKGGLVVAGRPDASLIWGRVADEEMPPDEPLPDDEKALLRRWIERGAAGLPSVAAGESEAADHWSFAPPRRPEVPNVRSGRLVRGEIDRFLQAALEAESLTLGDEADQNTLIRRVAFDLTGLPPTPDQISRFRDDPSSDAYERMVDRYLASPRHGERWGKLWLDAAGYADSNGYFDADSDRPLAYRYRDYVIACWNEDRPLDRFIRDQIAGDELAGYRPGRPPDRSTIEGLTATHFLRNAPDGTGESDGNPDELRADRYAVLEGTTQVIGSSLLGMTFQCARCHDHKFEPITQKDYYSLYAIIAPAYNVAEWVKPSDRVVACPPEPAELAAWEERSRRADAELETLAVEHAFKNPFSLPDNETREAIIKAVKAVKARRGKRLGQISWIAEPTATPPVVHILKRGQYGDPGPAVAPAPPSVLADPGDRFDAQAMPGGTSGRRLAFASWMTRPGSRPAALLARVLANRIWQGHFGVGLVATPENLGYSGTPPTNPELLEFLASELARSGWSAKALHRQILLSMAYRQSGRPDPVAARVDPENRLLWRYPLRRLDAEAVRDAMLAASGELDERPGGPYVPTERTAAGEVVVGEEVEGARRRSIYLQQRRTQVMSLLDVFDAPSIVTTCTKRSVTTMPLQSLSLLNSAFVVARARGFADRLRRECGADDGRRVERAFLLAAGRPSDESEQAAARKFLGSQPDKYVGQAEAKERAWADLCQMLLSSNAFLYVE
jgi:mono/diheme cytochrome c family protein